MITRSRLLLAAAAALTLALSACSSAPAPETSTAADAPAEVDPTTAARQMPAECSSLDLAPGAQLDGAALGACVARALSSYGSGKMRMDGDTAGDIEFTYTPDYSFQGEMQGFDGPVRITFLDGEMWIDSGSGPIRGDVNSENQEEQLAGLAGELYRFYSDLEVTAELIAAQPVWQVQDATELISLPSGDSVESFKIVSGGAFTWNDMPVSEFIVWFGEGWVPSATQATVDVMGMTSTRSQHFYDLGDPVTITPLG